jgi:nucleotide-binding universal stress UspA family protein
MSVSHDTQNAHDTYHHASEQVEGASIESAAASTPLTEPLSALETRRANAEAIERAPQTSEAVSEARRRGRIEAETHRISEEMTHLAQERRRAEEAHAQVATANSAALGAALGAETAVETASASDTARPAARTALPRPVAATCQFQRVLAALDGSFYAERALPYATALARLTGAELLLGYVRPPASPAPAQVIGRATAEMLSHEREPQASDVQVYLDALRALEAFHAPSVRVDSIEQRDAGVGVRLLAEQGNADVVALAMHMRQEVERQVLGSSAHALVAHSHLPLLVIPPNVIVHPEPSFKNVLVPLDGSPLAEQALSVLVGMIHASVPSSVIDKEGADWQITLFRVVARRALMAEALTYLDEVEARLRVSGLPQGAQIIKHARLGSAPGAIVATANHGVTAGDSSETSAGVFDLLALATHGRGGLGRLVYGSVARYVLSRVAVPVLLAHPAYNEK